MKPQRLLAVFAAVFVISALLVFGARLVAPAKVGAVETFAEKVDRSTPLWPVPDFAWSDQHAQTVTAAGLQGKVWVANFIFTQCRTICPLLTAKMVQLQRRLDGVDLRFVSFSVDPAHDTPEVLLAYQRSWHAEERRWSLIATDEQRFPAFAAGMHVTAEKNTGVDQTDPIIHSSAFLLVDAEGQVRGVYDSERREDFVALERDARALAGAPAAAASHAAESGATLYHAYSCAACHERPELAPSLHGLAGKRQELSDGLLATVDAAYVRESLLAPEAKRVRDYPLHMPTYDGVLDDAELSTLVDYVLALPAVSATPDPAAREEEDPVCHMKVRVVADTLAVEHHGHRFYFCSEYCRDRFAKNPDSFTPALKP